MATTTRIRDAIPGKERTLPHQANPTQRRATLNPSPSPSRAIGGVKSTSPSSDKNVPRNLRPTRSRLNVDQPTQPAAAKKLPAAASSDKSSFGRIRSFEKNSPAASQSPRARQSPNPKEKSMRTSSSFSGPRSTGTTVQKAASNRIVKTAPKDVVKKQNSPSEPLSLKKSNNETTKKIGGSSAGAAEPDILEQKDTEILESDTSEVDDHDAAEGSIKKEEAKDQNAHCKETSSFNLESQQLQEQIQEDSTDQKNENNGVQEEDQSKEQVKDAAEGSMKAEEAEDQNTPDKETSSFHLESQQLREQLEDNSSDPVNEHHEVQTVDQGKEEVKDATEPLEKVDLRETEEMQNIASPELEPQPKPDPGLSPTPAPEKTQTISVRHPIVQGKKELTAVSNGVIEETASKLQEQRKNRVRALAGAFETVILLQDK